MLSTLASITSEAYVAIPVLLLQAGCYTVIDLFILRVFFKRQPGLQWFFIGNLLIAAINLNTLWPYFGTFSPIPGADWSQAHPNDIQYVYYLLQPQLILNTLAGWLIKGLFYFLALGRRSFLVPWLVAPWFYMLPEVAFAATLLYYHKLSLSGSAHFFRLFTFTNVWMGYYAIVIFLYLLWKLRRRRVKKKNKKLQASEPATQQPEEDKIIARRPQPEEHILTGRWLLYGSVYEQDEVAKRIHYLTHEYLTEIAAGQGKNKLYRDPADGRYWELHYPKDHLPNGGPPALTHLKPAEVENKYPGTGM